MKRPIPSFASDQEAEDFVDTADLSEYDLSGGEFVQFRLQRKDGPANAASGKARLLIDAGLSANVTRCL